jgi:hypothetical protein
LLNSGTLSPNPWDLTLSGQNDWFYTGGTRTEDKAPQGCNLSADSSAGMAPGGFDADAAPNSNSDPSNISLLRAENGLDNGVHFTSRSSARISGSVPVAGVLPAPDLQFGALQLPRQINHLFIFGSECCERCRAHDSAHCQDSGTAPKTKHIDNDLL